MQRKRPQQYTYDLFGEQDRTIYEKIFRLTKKLSNQREKEKAKLLTGLFRLNGYIPCIKNLITVKNAKFANV